MKKVIFALIGLFSIACVTAAENYNGLELAPSEFRQRHLTHFVSLLEQYCIGQKSQKSATRQLLQAGGFESTEEYEDVYEQYYDGLSYAVSPESEYCTVDVMLEYEKGKLLFTLEEVRDKIETIGRYKLAASVEEYTDSYKSNKVLNIKQYYKKNGSSRNILELSYPIDHQDEYFMTISYYYKKMSQQ